MNQFDIIIVGGGVVGLSAAIAMKQRGFSVAVLDAGTLTVDTSICDPRVYAINCASQDLLETLGVWALLDKTRVSPYQHMLIWDAKNDAKIEFDSRAIGASQLGAIIEESVLKQALLQQAHTLKIDLFPGRQVNRVTSTCDHSFVYDNSDEGWQTPLLIVADGANSKTRDLLGVSLTSWSYHQQAIVVTVETEKKHQETAYQVFNPDGPLAFLPLTDSHQCSVVWSTTEERAAMLMALPEDEFAEQLRLAFASKLGKVALIGPRYQFPLKMRHVKQYAGSSWLLMGDAAHTIHPLAGLGLNIGLADLASWLRYCDEMKRPRALAAYQRQRQHAVWQIIGLMSGLKSLFINPLSPVVALRGLGLNLCNRFSPLKRLFIEYAAGNKG